MNHLKELGERILNEGTWLTNERTGKRCLTIPVHVATYTSMPIDSTRKQMFKAPIMELLGYIRGLENAQDFADLGSPTWFGNANETQAWLDNPARKGENDCGTIYQFSDELREIAEKLSKGVDDRGLIATAWKPETFDTACLRPCMFQHQFQRIGDTLYMTSIQRSADVPMAGSWNSIQCWVLLSLMAQVTGYKVGSVTHIINHAHVYEDQLELFQEQMSREPLEIEPVLKINPELISWDDLLTADKNDFSLEGYDSHPPIKYPFTV